MTTYADEVYYTDKYLQGRGAVITTAFPYYSKLASIEIKARTYDNIDETNIPDIVKDCTCEIAEYLYRMEKATSNHTDGVKSESVGEYSVSYRTSEEVRANATKDIETICRKWLADSGLMYRGVSAW